MTKERFSAEEPGDVGKPPAVGPVALTPERANDDDIMNNPLGEKKKLEQVFGADDVSRAVDDKLKEDGYAGGDGGGGDGGEGGRPSGSAELGGGCSPIKSMIHARERELSAIAGAKQTLLADKLRETQLELEDRNKKFHALRDDFHYNLRLLKVRAPRGKGEGP